MRPAALLTNCRPAKVLAESSDMANARKAAACAAWQPKLLTPEFAARGYCRAYTP